GYEQAGNLVARTDSNGRTTTYAYDVRDRLTQMTPDPVLGDPLVRFEYDDAGNRASMTDGTGTTNHSYDARDRLLEKATPQGTLSYTYDPTGNLASMRSSHTDGVWVEYTWNAANQLETVTDRRIDPGVTRVTYDDAGRRAGMTNPNGVVM